MQRKLVVREYKLNKHDNENLDILAHKALNEYYDVNSKQFIKDYYKFAVNFSSDLHETIYNYKCNSIDCLLIRGLDFELHQLQPTPKHMQEKKDEYTNFVQFKHFFISSFLGYPYVWKTQSSGSIVSDELPIQGSDNYPLDFDSADGLKFYAEDHLHCAEADFFTLMCMRNPKNTPTTLFPLDLNCIPDEFKDELFKQQFSIIREDSNDTGTCSENLKETEKNTMNNFNEFCKISILFGNYKNPFFWIDPEIISTENLSSLAKRAFEYICEEIEKARCELFLEYGEILAINNHRLVHGRSCSKASYDGYDRWIGRILTLEDVRKNMQY